MRDRERSLEEDDDGESVFDGQKTTNYLVFVVGSLRRHAILALSVVATVLAVAGVSLWALPRTYHAEAKLLAQRNQALQVRGDGPGAEAPTRAAAEAVMRRSNLVTLIAQTDLLTHWEANRAPGERMRDFIVRAVTREATEEERIDAMVERLEKMLRVWTNEGTVSIAIEWPEPHMAYRLVDISQQNYLEARYAQEITALGESLAILESHASGLRAAVDEAVAKVAKLRDAREAGKSGGGSKGTDQDAARPTARARAAADPQADKPTGPDPELAQLRATIQAKQRALDDLSDFRRRRQSELVAKLAELRATYTENHPSVIDAQQAIGSMSAESPQIKALRLELGQLRAEHDTRASAAAPDGPRPTSSSVSFAATPHAAPSALPGDLTRLDLELREDREPSMVYARGLLRDAMDKYAALREKVQGAQIDLETAQAGFKYRYSVVTPAHVPKKPIKPNVALVLIGGFLAGLLSALIAAVLADLRAGVLLERWQVERMLDRPVLAEIDVRALPGGSPE